MTASRVRPPATEPKLICLGKYKRHWYHVYGTPGKPATKCVRCGARRPKNWRRQDGAHKPPDRPQISREDQERLLEQLVVVAQARRGTIEDAARLRDEEDARHREIMRAIQEGHEEANDSLVSLFDLLYDRGISKTVMCERIGMSFGRMIQLRERAKKRRDEKEVDDMTNEQGD